MKGIPMEERCPGWQSGQCNQKVLPKPKPTHTKDAKPSNPSREASEAIVPARGLRQRLALFGLLGLSGLALLTLALVPRRRGLCSAA
mmetsp:Transcript_28496/g.46008  ORF Transcript_28496/g.46008 Transcript_28496/m.46008 type:complete len:87 (+) Transcript_28496:156-416(+)